MGFTKGFTNFDEVSENSYVNTPLWFTTQLQVHPPRNVPRTMRVNQRMLIKFVLTTTHTNTPTGGAFFTRNEKGGIRTANFWNQVTNNNVSEVDFQW